MTLRLASASPRRQLLLPLLGFSVVCDPRPISEEASPGEAPLDLALRLSEAKARATTPSEGESVVGADTLVILEGRQLGKPRDEREASEMLAALRERSHQVCTGIAILTATGRCYRAAVQTRVQMRAYTDRELERYVASGRPLDKAGAYAIQDEEFNPVERVDGCFLNVVGLPLCEVNRGLRYLGWDVGDERDDPPCHWCGLGQVALAAAT